MDGGAGHQLRLDGHGPIHKANTLTHADETQASFNHRYFGVEPSSMIGNCESS